MKEQATVTQKNKMKHANEEVYLQTHNNLGISLNNIN